MRKEDIRSQIEAALRGVNADYIELRVEQGASTHLRYRGRELEEVGSSSSLGGCARVAVKGGWGFVSFNRLEGLPQKVETAVRQARLVGREETTLASVEPVVEEVPPHLVMDPRTVPLARKKELLDGYNGVILSTPGVESSSIGYGEGHRKVYFANSLGSFIVQERVDVSVRLTAIARSNGEIQQAGISLGALGDFSFVERLHDQAKETAQKAVALVKAPPVKGGEYPVVLDPVLAGVFIHEAFGHLSEADHVYENERLRELMVLGRRFGGQHLNVVDGAGMPGLRGSYKYDDEGAPAGKTYLLREGVLVGRLHSRETAAKMGEPITANARAIGYTFPPIVRMTNTIIEPGNVSFADMVAEIKEGVYAKNWYGGMTSMEMFTFSSGEAYMIRNGRIEEPVRPVMLSGNLFITLENLDAVGDDLEINQGGGCGKAGQVPLPVSNGSPHIRIRSCLVGGK